MILVGHRDTDEAETRPLVGERGAKQQLLPRPWTNSAR